MSIRGGSLGSSHSRFFFLCHFHPSLAFLYQLPASLPCVCACFVFMTTPVIRRHCRAAGVNTAEVHYAAWSSCLLPGSRRCFCVCSLEKCSFMHALSLGPHTQGLGLCMFWVSPTSGQPGMAFWKASCLWNLYIHVSYRVISWTGLYVPIFYSTYTLKVPCTTCLIHPFMPIHTTTCFYA